MFCPRCGNAVTSGGRFCFYCGAPLLVTQASGGGAGNGHDEPPAESKPTVISGDPLEGRVIEGKYRLDARIGAGGMGAVYRATRLLIGDTVAIKLLHADFTSGAEAERFRREAQAAARLKHPNAVSVYDFGVTNEGTVYLVMELVEGESLRQVIKKYGALEPRMVGEIVRQVCAALDEAHRQSIVHRDIKPDNIIVHEAPHGLRVKVLDFGIAKLRDLPVSNLTQTGSVVGTPHYMSPEQCLGEELDHRADIYSAGVVLYEMLCGVLPFNATILSAVIVQHVNQPPPPLREKNHAITAAVERAVLHALEKNRESRPQTARALAEEVSAALEGRVPVEEATWDSRQSVETAPAAERPAAYADAGPTAPREGGASSQASGRQLVPTEVLQTPPSLSGRVNPVNPHQSTALPAAGPQRLKPLLIGASAAALVLVVALVGIVVWSSRGGGAGNANASNGGGASQNARTAQNGEQGSKGGGAKTGREARDNATPPGMAYLAGGVFTMGSNDGDEYERPAHSVTVKPFYMDKYEVTCEEYARFLQESNHPRLPAGWGGKSAPNGAARLPVAGVTWDDANAYARWAGKRLPTEEEWEFAARGTDGRRFPWGNDWRAGLANAAESAAREGLAEVGKYAGASASGILDLSGNVWEWTSSQFAVYPGGRSKPPGAGDYRVVRGGSWDSSREWATTTYRGYWPRDTAKPTIGFRCAKDAAQ